MYKKKNDKFRIVPSKHEFTSVQFNLVNTTSSDFIFNLFNGYTINLIPTFRLPIPNPPSYISGSIGYNFFILGLANSPLMVRQIMMVAENIQQLNQPLELVTKDANGIEFDLPRLPNIQVSVNQYQPLISYVNFRSKELILNDQTTIKYLVAANSTVKLVMLYKQVPKVSIFTDKLGVCDKNHLHKHVPNNRTEQELLFQSKEFVIKV